MEKKDDSISEEIYQSGSLGTLQHRSGKWISGFSGGVAGAVITFTVLVLPSLNTYLANAKDISLAGIKDNADKIAILTKEHAERMEYITQRMKDADKERDLYKSEMLSCQKELRSLRLGK